MSDTIRFHVRTVAPIHIGCDEVYEPTTFIVDEQKGVLKSFDPLAFVRALSPADKKKFSDICAKGTIESLLEIYRFMRGKNFRGRAVSLCPGFMAHYQDTMKLPAADRRKIQQELNNFAIARTAFNPNTGLPYIPGSSIKGALRTAWLNKMQREKKIRKDDRRKGKELEKELLDGGDFSSDPLRMLKVSDFMPVGKVKTRIVYAVNEKKKLSEFGAKGQCQILEVIEPGSLFEGNITVETPPPRDIIRHPIERNALIAAAMRFYGEDLQRENGELERINIGGVHPETPSGGFLLRIGRHSGAESVTIAGHRSIRIMQGRDKTAVNLDHATTFWLAAEERKPVDKSNLRPFGWVTVDPGAAPAPVISEDDLADDLEESSTPGTPTPAPPKPPAPEKTAVEKILDELAMIKPDEKGRLGTIIQKMETLPEDRDKAAVALAIREKLGKEYKKHKRRDYLDALIGRVENAD